MNEEFEMGIKVKDKITGFSGIITGYCSYITGCDQCLLQPEVKSDGDFVSARWFDVTRLEVIIEEKKSVKIEGSEDDPGACDSASIK